LCERRGPIEPALRGGLNLRTIRDLAQTLRSNAHHVSSLELPAPLSEAEVSLRIHDFLQRSQRYRSLALEPDDRLLHHLDDAITWLQNPAARDRRPRRPGGAGCRDNWRNGKETVPAVKELIREITTLFEAHGKLGSQRLLNQVVCWLRDDFLPVWKTRKQAGGFLEFEDQLQAARQLLLRSRAARREFQKRFATLLVDEFQDTDPTQLDIVLLLSCTDLDQTDPARLAPAPGRLFIVGDPKQSIYRFRGADIETYLEVVDDARISTLGLERVEISTNYRSVPSILRFVDEAFRDVMKKSLDGLYQRDYLAFGAAGARAGAGVTPSVTIVGDRDESGALKGSGPQFIRLESTRLAKLIREIHGNEEWLVEEAGSSFRAPRFGDIAILLPVLTRADILEEELRDAGIPYVLEGGKFYYARSEVSSAVTVLRAVSNPNDKVALYGALRSIFFGLSDEDLLRARMEGQPLDYRSQPAPGSPLRRPFEVLRDLHLLRLRRPASETYETLLHRTGVREVLAARGFQSIANLYKLGRTLRILQPEKTFSQVVESLQAMDAEGVAETESRVMEERSDAVRVLSIHKAKGLDFPIVIVAGLGISRRQRTSNFLADAHRKRMFAVGTGLRETRVETPGWTELAEEDSKREEQESIRLLYVALTRPRDHLILSTHHRGKPDSSDSGWEADFAATRLKPLGRFLGDKGTKDASLARFLDGHAVDRWTRPMPVEDSDGPADWEAALRMEYAELHRILSATAGSSAVRAVSQESREGDDRVLQAPDVVRSRAIRLGLAFHEVMERANFAIDAAAALEMVQETALRHNLGRKGTEELSLMLRNALGSPLLARALRASSSGGRMWRELPFVRPSFGGDVPVEGKIDLLFEEDGAWVLVDYKTDQVPREAQDVPVFFRERYSAQVRDYLAALQDLALRVKAAYLLLARTGDAIEIFPS
jgi:ATP-dependent helicase/nuclease subunit A